METIEEVVRFLEGRHSDVRDRLAKRMDSMAADLDFENAARVRDCLLYTSRKALTLTLALRVAWIMARRVHGEHRVLAGIPVLNALAFFVRAFVCLLYTSRCV